MCCSCQNTASLADVMVSKDGSTCDGSLCTRNGRGWELQLIMPAFESLRQLVPWNGYNHVGEYVGLMSCEDACICGTQTNLSINETLSAIFLN